MTITSGAYDSMDYESVFGWRVLLIDCFILVQKLSICLRIFSVYTSGVHSVADPGFFPDPGS